jgi:acyl transferase domain-containing protein
MMQAGGDAVGSVPSARWTLSAEVDMATLSADQVAGQAHGAFMAGAEEFDGRCFGVPVAEGEVMDPHQRLVLETGYQSLHSCALRRAALTGRDMGVLVGISKTDFQQLAGQGKLFATALNSVYAGPGGDLGVAPRRLAYVLGLHGPAFAVHTACSSG